MCKAVEFLEQLSDISNDMIVYQNNLFKQLSQFDLMEQDVLHKIERDTFNAAQGYKLAKTLKDIRNKRRVVKNEIETFKYIVPLQQSISTRVKNVNVSINKTENKIRNFKYHPRTNILKVV